MQKKCSAKDPFVIDDTAKDLEDKEEARRLSRRSFIPRPDTSLDLSALNEDITDAALGLGTDDDDVDDDEDDGDESTNAKQNIEKSNAKKASDKGNGSEKQENENKEIAKQETKEQGIAKQETESEIAKQETENPAIAQQETENKMAKQEAENTSEAVLKQETKNTIESAKEISDAEESGQVEQNTEKASRELSGSKVSNEEQKTLNEDEAGQKEKGPGEERVQVISDALGDIGLAAQQGTLERKSDIMHKLPKQVTQASTNVEISGSGDSSMADKEKTTDEEREATIKNLYNTLSDSDDRKTVAEVKNKSDAPMSVATASKDAVQLPKVKNEKAERRSKTVKVRTQDEGN